MSEIRLSDRDAYALRRAMARMERDASVPVTPGIALLLNSFDLNSDEGYQQLNRILTTNQSLIEQIIQVDPTTPPQSETKTDENIVYVPALPEAAQLTDEMIAAGENVGQWYKRTVEWASQRSPMTPRHFLETGVIWLIGLIVARRVYVEVHERIYPHLYLLWVAETSKYAKSTGLNVIYKLATSLFPYMLIPGNTSPEGMMEMMSGEQPGNFDKLSKRDRELVEAGRAFAAQRGILMDEYSGMLAAQKKDYMSGFVELLMRLYDARDYEQSYTRSGGLLTLRNPAISILGATTPAAMARSLKSEDWENGNMARFLCLFREDTLPYSDSYIGTIPPNDITQSLVFLFNRLPRFKDNMLLDNPDFAAIRAVMTDETKKQYEAYAKAMRYDLLNDDLDARLVGNYSRLHIQALKISSTLAIMDWAEQGATGNPVIQIGHFAIAQQIVEHARANLHQLMTVLSESKDARTQRDILSLLKRRNVAISVRDICQVIRNPAKQIRSAIEILVESGQVEVIDHKPSTGRPTKLYRVSSPNLHN